MERVWGRFEIVGPLREGGMASLYLAHDEVEDGYVVLKTLRDDVEDKEAAARSLHNEIEVTAQLCHDEHDARARHVVSHIAHGAWRDRECLAIEHISGVDVADLVEREGPLPLSAALSVGIDVAEALAFVHGVRCASSGAPMSLVHGDISPDNIVIDREGEAHLIDFGSVRAQGLRGVVPSASDVVIGKPGYLAPELAAGVFDHRADQYALGVVLWEMLVGQPLFRTVEHGAVRPLSRALGLPLAVDAVIMRMLAEVPELRYANIDAARSALEALRTPLDARDGRAALTARVQACSME